MITQPVVDLAERLAHILPAPLQKSFFLNTGSETTEAAIKMAKCHAGKFEIVAFTASYHGLTQGSGSATYSAGRKNGGPDMPASWLSQPLMRTVRRSERQMNRTIGRPSLNLACR